MINKEDYEFLKSLPHLDIKPNVLDFLKAWYCSDETVLAVARTLNEQGIFRSIDAVINFFEKPSKREQDIQNLIKEYDGSNIL